VLIERSLEDEKKLMQPKKQQTTKRAFPAGTLIETAKKAKKGTNDESDQTLVGFDAPQANYHLLFVLGE
jgi:hypothetical protein